MKKIFLICILWGSINLIYAQDLTVTHTKIPVTDVVVDTWTATLNDDISFYKDTFTDFTKQEFGVKAKSDGKTEMAVEKASINRVSEKRGDLRMTFFTDGSDTKLALSYMLGYDIWINPENYPDGMEQLRQLTRDYLRYHYTNYYNDIIEKDMKVIDGHKKDIDRSEKSISNMRKQISKNEQKLREETNANRRANMEKKNQQNRENIDRLSAEIPVLHSKIDALDEHVQQIKTYMTNVEAQYYEDSGALSIPSNQQGEKQFVEEQDDPLDDIENFDDKDEGEGQ